MSKERRLREIKAIESTILEYRAMIKEILLSGTASGSMGSAGNTQSYTRMGVKDYRKEISSLQRERSKLVREGRARRSSPDFDGGF